MKHVEVPLSPGLNALVGRNGAGKSRVLAAVEAALTGKGLRDLTTHLLFEVVDGDPDSRTSHMLTWSSAIRTVSLGSLDSIREVDQEASLQRILARAQQQIRDLDPSPSGTALIESRVFAWVQRSKLRPSLWAAVRPNSEGPETQYLKELDAAWRTVADHYTDDWLLSEDVEDSWFEYEHGGSTYYFNGGEVSPATGQHLPVPVLELDGFRDDRRNPTVVSDVVDMVQTMKQAKRLLGDAIGPEHFLGLGLNMYATGKGPDTAHDYVESLTALRDDLGVGEWPPPLAKHLSLGASQILRRLYPEAPNLECRITEPRKWLLGEAIEWKAQDASTGAWVPLERLSSSQRRWAELAITLAVRDEAQLGQYVLFDEPERGLHRRAEFLLSAGLAASTRVTQTSMIVATHSPLVVAHADSVIEVMRDDSGNVIANPVGDELQKRAEALGMLPSDVVTMAQTLVIVEGQHDRLVIEQLLGDFLDAHKVLVVPIGGVKERDGVVNAELLGLLGHPRMVLVVDALGIHVEEVWESARVAAADGDSKSAKRALNSVRGNGYESDFVKGAGHRLLAAGRLDQVAVLGMSIPDILEVLPCEEFVPGHSWEGLRNEYGTRRGRHESFKEYLYRAHHVRFTIDTIGKAVGALDEIPADLNRLKTVIESVTPTSAADSSMLN